VSHSESVRRTDSEQSGLVIIDKPSGWTSHDVVARIRRLAGMRRVGHAGTLDPMATGVLVVGLGKATRMLGYLTLTTKKYEATIRLGASTTTDDAEGELLIAADSSALEEISDADISSALSEFQGQIEQVPSSVSAIKVNGVRAYTLARAGEEVALKARTVVIYSLTSGPVERGPGWLDLQVAIECSSGTYIRAIARDLGARLGVGGHLTALRRTAVGPYDIDQAHTLESLESHFAPLPVADAARAMFASRELSEEEAQRVRHGSVLPESGEVGTVAAFSPSGELIALMEDRDGACRPLAVLSP
jgi:tRNA pseudouridine55 synthase